MVIPKRSSLPVTVSAMWTTFKKSSRSPIVGVVESKKFGKIISREREKEK
jgi:hypothetical protein